MHYFSGRSFRGQKVSREENIAKLRALTFTNDVVFFKFRDKSFRDQEKSALSGEKTSAIQEK